MMILRVVGPQPRQMEESSVGAKMSRMIGMSVGKSSIAIVIVLALFPVLIGISGGLASAIIGAVLQRDGEIRHEGSELAAIDD